MSVYRKHPPPAKQGTTRDERELFHGAVPVRVRVDVGLGVHLVMDWFLPRPQTREMNFLPL